MEGLKNYVNRKKMQQARDSIRFMNGSDVTYDAIKYALENARSGDVIILAGKGHETYQILKEGTIHLDEREVVAEALNQKT